MQAMVLGLRAPDYKGKGIVEGSVTVNDHTKGIQIGRIGRCGGEY